ncbi:TetR family transcriptional regulator [Leucobacter luti]|uniref:TetR family transcriptional regulator n=2 Tax=Leucobacter luti TaxID=340320 RepID=A0A4Q7U3I1_9MICO|nr:TetR family transcriptional regulator [Leucobacter luti]
MSEPVVPQDTAPRRRDPEARRREILAAAAELAAEHGPAALTHRAIAARAGVPLGSTTQHFASIDELREAALQQLADEIDESLESIGPLVADIVEDPSHAVAEILVFLRDRRAVQSDIALIASGSTDQRLRALALRWNERLVEILTPTLGHDQALALSVYLDGATVHASLHEEPLSAEHLTRVFTALSRLPAAREVPARPEVPVRSGPAGDPDRDDLPDPGPRRTSEPTH